MTLITESKVLAKSLVIPSHCSESAVGNSISRIFLALDHLDIDLHLNISVSRHVQDFKLPERSRK